MVLKKSNTPFNSGATQRCFKRRVYNFRSTNDPSELMLSITLKGLPSVYDKNNPSTEHAKALEKIYDYLGYSGPSLKTFHGANGEFFWDTTQKSLSISLSRQELWLIPERVHELMNEKNFLDGDEGFAEIRVRSIKRIADRSTVHNKESCVLNSKGKKKSKACSERKKKILKGNKRGLQRPHLFTAFREDEIDDDYYRNLEEQYGNKVVEIELQEKDQVDARVLGCRFEGYKYWKREQSMSKSKSSLHGKNSYLYKMFSPLHIRKQSQAVFNSAKLWEEEDYYLSDDHDDDADEVIENCEEYYNSCNREQILCDYVVASSENHRVKKKRNHRETTHANEEQFVSVNTASSQTTIKHPKGSFQFIPRPCDLDENRESKIPPGDDFVNVSKGEVEESHNDNSESQDINSEKAEIPIKFDTFQTDDNFVAVNLQFPKDIRGTMILSSDKYPVMLGNCFPPVFSVNLQQENLSFENEWTLVGTSCSDVFTNEDLTWEVTLKSTKSYSEHDNDKVKNHFFSNLDLMSNYILQFNELVELALVSVQNASSNLIDGEIVPTPKYVAIDFKNDMSAVTSNNAPSPKVCSMEEALKSLQADQTHNSQHLASPSATKNNQIKIPSENVECGICFDTCDNHGLKDSGLITLLPCNHSFCYECWRSHIFYHTKTSTTEIRCMHTDCKEVLNETMMKALIPEKHLVKLYTQRQERRIDASPLCQWCPKSKCNKVSMITERSQHVQEFGCCVVCDCKNLYCFSCQANPHWPMSCSQAAAYRNLLYKLGGEIPVEITCNVELKPCPGCGYPIEKNEGCPHMKCRMCGFDFCWKCLKYIYTHNLWSCPADEDSNTKTYKLHTEVINSFPLKFFANALEMKRKLKSISKGSVQGWLIRLRYVGSQKINLSFERSVKLEEETMAKTKAVCLATEVVSFLMDSYSFLEYFYVLLSFSLLNEEKQNSPEVYLSTQRVMDRLISTALRLEDQIVGKSLRQLLVSENTGQMFLENGRDLLGKLKSRVASTQRTSQDVPAKPIGELDPKKYYRHK